uniref:Uncharacterized protein n=1 Tax=Compsopogon caeruleus TaxID=31354 RepID=A0A7S1TJB0_9RHOD
MAALKAVEAFRIFGWKKFKENLVALHYNYQLVRDASSVDDQVDENQDGVRDVLQISRKELWKRKMKLVLKTIDPDQVSKAFAGLIQGWLAVLATLTIRSAEAITIGTTIGDIGDRVIGPRPREALLVALPRDYEQLVPVLLQYFWRAVGFWIAFVVQSAIGAFYSSVRGAEIFMGGLRSIIVRRDIGREGRMEPGNFLFTILFAMVWGFGFWWQLTLYYHPPVSVNIILLPLTFLEWIISLILPPLQAPRTSSGSLRLSLAIRC